MTSKAVFIGDQGAQAWHDARSEIERLRQELAGLEADRESLTEIAIELRGVLQQVARRAATAQTERSMSRHWTEELRSIQDMCDKALRK